MHSPSYDVASTVLADLALKAMQKKSRTRTVRLVWTVRNVEQCGWLMSELLETARTASAAGLDLAIDFFVTRGALSTTGQTIPFLPSLSATRHNSVASIGSFDSLYFPQGFEDASRRSSIVGDETLDRLLESGADAAFRQGRPDISALTTTFLRNSGRGQSLVVVCGPPKMAKIVALETQRLGKDYPVSIEVATFEC